MKHQLITLTLLFTASVAFGQEPAKPAATPAEKKPLTAEELIKRYDKDGDGAVTLEEYSALSKGDQKEKAKAKFLKRDKNKDGKLTVDEI